MHMAAHCAGSNTADMDNSDFCIVVEVKWISEENFATSKSRKIVSIPVTDSARFLDLEEKPRRKIARVIYF